MTEITRVPLQPIAKGSLVKLWLGVLVVLLAALALAWTAMPASVKVETVKAGAGPAPTLDDVVMINYKGTLDNGTAFDQANGAIFPLQGVIPGFTKALQQMQRGGKYKVKIPAALGYGAKASGQIPANSDLNFEVELLDYINRAEYEQRMQQMQQQQGAQGAGAPPPPGAGPPSGAVPPPGTTPPQGR